MIGPPDFVGVGAQRSGTSWWFSLICEHPDVAGAESKELHFFDRFSRRDFGPSDVERYHAAFERSPGQLAGEWTPNYMYDHWTPALLAEAAPEARLLVMLRDPVDRYESNLAHARRTVDLRLGELAGAQGEGGDLDRLTTLIGYVVANDTLHRSRYHAQLTRLLELFPRDRLLVLQYERCLADPVGCLRDTFEFLGVEPLAPSRATIDRSVGALTDPPALPGHMRASLAGALAADVAALECDFPEIDTALWRSFQEAVQRLDR